MAEFQFKCPQCGQMIEADESFCGQVAPCPFCEKNIVVPSATSKPKPKQPISWKQEQQTTSQGDTVDNPVELQPETTTAQKAKTGFWRRLRACFTTKGRAQRKEFWIIEGVSLIFGLLIGLFVIFVVSSKHATAASKSSLIPVVVLGLVFGIASLCVWIRRLHDLNRSEWWLLSPIVGRIACKSLGFSLFSILMDLALLAWLIVLGSIDGTAGENDYGSDPKGRAGSGERTNTAKIAVWILAAISTAITVIAVLAGNLMPELFEKEEEAELQQSTPSEKEVVSSPSSSKNNADMTVVNGVAILKLPDADFEKVENEDGDEIYAAKLSEKDGFTSCVTIESQGFNFASAPITLQQMKNFTSRDIKKFMDAYIPNTVEACKKELKEQGLDVDITIIERSGNTGTIFIDFKTHYACQKRILDIQNGRALLVTGLWKSHQDKNIIQACVSSARLAAP